MLMGVLYAPAYIVMICARVRIYTAWVSALLIRDLRFSQDRNERISKKEIRVFYLDSRNFSFPRLDKDLVNAIYVSTGIFVCMD